MPPRAVFLLLLTLGVLLPAPSTAETLRGGASWGWDSNVREAMEAESRLEARFLRLLVEGVPRPLDLGRQTVRLRARGMTEHYVRYPTETRYQVETNMEASRPVREKSALWLAGSGEFRAYPDSLARSYHRESATAGVAAALHGGDLGLSTSLRGFDYRRTHRFDRTSWAVAAEYHRSLHRRLELSTRVAFEWARFGRDAVRRPTAEQGGDESIKPQRDRSREARLSAQYLRGFLFESFLAWESVRSNSLGYSVGRRSVGGMVSGWLPGTVLLQVRGRAESTSYRDSGLADVYILRTGEDQESGEDNNSIQVRLRRPLKSGWSLEGRVSWFRNESLLVGSYYRKALGSLGVVWTPVGSSDF